MRMQALRLVVLALFAAGCGSDDSGTSSSSSGNCTDSLPAAQEKSNSLYTNNGDGTITDQETNLSWAACSLGQSNDASCSGTADIYSWADALNAAQTANADSFLGHSDWRLPNVTELASLVDSHCEDVAINSDVFPSTVENQYWSSTPGPNARAWLVDFAKGGAIYHAVKRGELPVRLVRGGQ